MNILHATKTHLQELAALQRMYMEYHSRLDDYFLTREDASTRWIAYMKKFLKQNDTLAVIAVEDEKIIGYMTSSIYERRPIYKIGRVGLIGDNFVLPECRGRGVFSKMLDETLSWMKTKGIKYVEHPIAANNKLGRTVWKKKGFENMTVFTKKRISAE
jgi:GNAT superfamily N-acetyltransferase